MINGKILSKCFQSGNPSHAYPAVMDGWYEPILLIVNNFRNILTTRTKRCFFLDSRRGYQTTKKGGIFWQCLLSFRAALVDQPVVCPKLCENHIFIISRARTAGRRDSGFFLYLIIRKIPRWQFDKIITWMRGPCRRRLRKARRSRRWNGREKMEKNELTGEKKREETTKSNVHRARVSNEPATLGNRAVKCATVAHCGWIRVVLIARVDEDQCGRLRARPSSRFSKEKSTLDARRK